MRAYSDFSGSLTTAASFPVAPIPKCQSDQAHSSECKGNGSPHVTVRFGGYRLGESICVKQFTQRQQLVAKPGGLRLETRNAVTRVVVSLFPVSTGLPSRNVRITVTGLSRRRSKCGNVPPTRMGITSHGRVAWQSKSGGETSSSLAVRRRGRSPRAQQQARLTCGPRSELARRSCRSWYRPSENIASAGGVIRQPMTVHG